MVEDKIVYFGSSDQKATFVLEKEEEMDQLRGARKDSVIDFERGDQNTASRVF